MHLFDRFTTTLKGAIKELVGKGILPEGLPIERISVEPPREAKHGCLATNAAMVLNKAAQMPPRDIAQHIMSVLENDPMIDSMEIAGPGFINITLTPDTWYKELQLALKEGLDFGNLTIGKSKPINVEYVSANPTGPMHIGHARSAVVGDTLARLLTKAGYNVTKEYYINDAGSQVDTLARSTLLRYKEALGENIGDIPEGLYPGDYLVATGKALKEKYGNRLLQMSEDEQMHIIKPFAIEQMMDLIRTDLQQLGITHDVFVSEKLLHDTGKIPAALNLLQKKGLLYEGVLPPPKGKENSKWEAREQTLFKSTQFGDDVDRALKKPDGNYSYFASDIAYHLDKYERGFHHMVLLLGSDHHGYLKRMKAAVSALSGNTAHLEILFNALVNFLENGKPIKMSKRAGQYLTVGDVVDAVGKDIVRFMMLMRKNDMVLDFDFTKVKEQSKDNPVFYVQYAHARCASVLRNTDIKVDMSPSLDILAQLTDEDELAVIKQIGCWPRVIEMATRSLEPHRIAFYLYDLAACFHGLWNKGKKHDSLRFIIEEDVPKTTARLCLVKAVATTIASGLALLNVTPLEEMR